jgi:hypothetical protein
VNGDGIPWLISIDFSIVTPLPVSSSESFEYFGEAAEKSEFGL